MAAPKHGLLVPMTLTRVEPPPTRHARIRSRVSLYLPAQFSDGTAKSLPDDLLSRSADRLQLGVTLRGASCHFPQCFLYLTFLFTPKSAMPGNDPKPHGGVLNPGVLLVACALVTAIVYILLECVWHDGQYGGIVEGRVMFT
jgi:hypothetical protein